MEKKAVKTTRKVTSKSQITGTRNLVDEDTGEKVSVVEAISQTQDVNWHKLWITHLISALDIVG
ncbi:replication/maintenance protein RepL, partial [Priestia megaterium]|uniref:replication/maintenance protein RepL n=1 Tax=Priestia megaterium TaxID=1404 RepID=UPI00203EF016